ncbi:hypothetical protein PAMP_002689 [Pampus punctatissimus]
MAENGKEPTEREGERGTKSKARKIHRADCREQMKDRVVRLHSGWGQRSTVAVNCLASKKGENLRNARCAVPPSYHHHHHRSHAHSFHAPSYDRPAPERPSYDRPSFDRPSFDRPSHERPIYDRPIYDRLSHDRPPHDHWNPRLRMSTGNQLYMLDQEEGDWQESLALPQATCLCCSAPFSPVGGVRGPAVMAACHPPLFLLLSTRINLRFHISITADFFSPPSMAKSTHGLKDCVLMDIVASSLKTIQRDYLRFAAPLYSLDFSVMESGQAQ